MKTVQILLPDNLHDQLQRKAAEAGFDVTAYILALLSESVTPNTDSASQPNRAAQVQQPSLIPTPPAPPVTPTTPQPTPQRTPFRYVHQTGGTKGPQSNISIVIRWDLVGKGGPESIRAATAAATLVRVIQRLHEMYGAGTLEKIEQFRVSRGPLVSRNPGRDFLNQTTRETYANHLIPGTQHFVLTHSSTDQKIQDLRELIRFLKLPDPLFEIAKHRKN